MAKFGVILSPAAIRDLEELNASLSDSIQSGLEVLAEDPFPRGKLIKKLRGKKTTYYRIRIRDFRVFYFIDKLEVVILRPIAKKDAHRFIKNF